MDRCCYGLLEKQRNGSATASLGSVMMLFAGVLKLRAWSAHDTLSLAVSVVYIVVFAGLGIRWFQWDAR